MVDVPRSHPRYESLMTRAAIERGVDAGLVARQGLIAHGRGEAPTEPFSDSGAPAASAAAAASSGPRPALRRGVLAALASEKRSRKTLGKQSEGGA